MASRRVSPSGSGAFTPPAPVALVAVLVLGLAPGHLLAADLSADVSVDSSIELIQKASIGPHEVLSINMTTRLGETTLTVDKDGQRNATSMPYEDCEALWQFLFERDIASMGDAIMEDPTPDLAEFTFTFQNGAETHKFSAYGVEFLSDSRYKEIAVAILKASKSAGLQEGP